MPPTRSVPSYQTDEESEWRITAAKADWESGKYPSIRKAAKAHDVARQTLNDRIKGKLSKRATAQAKQMLTPTQESVLVDWIDHRAVTAKPFNANDIRTLAHNMTGIILGKNWHRRFQKRHPELISSKPSNLDPKRAQNFNRANVTKYFGLVQDVLDRYPSLPPQHIWNMDEKGVQLGGGRKQAKKYYRLRTLKQSKFYRIRSDNLELVTIIECISPAGFSVPPTFILADGPKPALIDLHEPIGGLTTSPNGWTDNEIGFQWFLQTFIPFALSKKVNEDLLLLFVDGHDSHETDRIRELGFQHNVIIIAFPSKCTHKLQPLDVVVFAQTQRQWSRHCSCRIVEGVRIDRYNIIQEYMKVRTFMTPELLSSAFRATGIFPFNPNTFSDVDFAPAKSFSTKMHVPNSFPQEVPSSPPAVATDAEVDSNTSESDLDLSSDSEIIDWSTDVNDLDYEPPDNDNLVDTPSYKHSRSSSANLTISEQTLSSVALAASIALDHSKAPFPSTTEEKDSELRWLRYERELLQKALVQANAELMASNTELMASNAHCTVMTRSATEARTELENQKKKTRQSVKTGPRYLTHPEIREQWNIDQAEKAAREKEAAEKEAEKAVQDAARTARIQEETASRVFTGSLTSYKRKDDLITLAGALELPTTGVVAELAIRIKAHIEAHPELEQNPRFTGLFHRNRRG